MSFELLRRRKESRGDNCKRNEIGALSGLTVFAPASFATYVIFGPRVLIRIPSEPIVRPFALTNERVYVLLSPAASKRANHDRRCKIDLGAHTRRTHAHPACSVAPLADIYYTMPGGRYSGNQCASAAAAASMAIGNGSRTDGRVECIEGGGKSGLPRSIELQTAAAAAAAKMDL